MLISAGQTPTVSSNDPQVDNSTLITHFNKNGWYTQSNKMHVLPSSKEIFHTISYEFCEIYNRWRDRAKNTTEVVEKIRTKQTIDGKKLFAPKDYLTHEQITAAFSWMAKHWTGKLTKPTQKDKQVETTFHENDDPDQLMDISFHVIIIFLPWPQSRHVPMHEWLMRILSRKRIFTVLASLWK